MPACWPHAQLLVPLPVALTGTGLDVDLWTLLQAPKRLTFNESGTRVTQSYVRVSSGESFTSPVFSDRYSDSLYRAYSKHVAILAKRSVC